MQKITRKPETERKSVACVILGTDLGLRNNGAAVLTVSHWYGHRIQGLCL